MVFDSCKIKYLKITFTTDKVEVQLRADILIGPEMRELISDSKSWFKLNAPIADSAK